MPSWLATTASLTDGLRSCKTFLLILCSLTIIYSVSANGMFQFYSGAKPETSSQHMSPFDIIRYGITDP